MPILMNKNWQLCMFLGILCSLNFAIAQENYVTGQQRENAFTLFNQSQQAVLLIDTADFKGVKLVAKDLSEDFERVSGKLARIDSSGSASPEMPIIIGTIGKSKLIDQLAENGKLDINNITGKWETFQTQIINDPMPGIKQALVIAGSDKRGTIYGMYDLSEKMGVSPWYWWADVPVKKKESLYVKPGIYSDGTPEIQYRGIFINDEAPALSGWVGENFGDFNSQFYEHVFELILRLKANFLWPAMWGRAFYDDDPRNPVLADDYGVVISTSHHEPLMRAHAEWERYGNGPWDYTKNKDSLQAFWKKGIERMQNNESLVTVGMRGDGDEPMTEGTAIDLLEQIVADQRTIISDVTGKPASETPQVWALYKEVQDYYDKGMRVPDDVTLLLADDNWGNIRKLPDPDEKERAGGYGIYYHFDYVGGPRNYKWINTSQISRVYEQMSLAYAYEANKLWIVNVGDIKPMEYPISFFLDYAWKPSKFNLKDLQQYPKKWAAEQFGEQYSEEIGELLQSYTTLNSRRKPELLSPETYSLEHYQEAERIWKSFEELEKKTQMLGKKLPEAAQSAYFELVLFPIEASANLNRLYIASAKNQLYANQGRNSANEWGEKVKEYFRRDQELAKEYHALENGKWNHMMSQTHIGYTYWQEPKENKMPEIASYQASEKGELGIAIPGDSTYFPQQTTLKLLPFDRSHPENQLTLFNRGKSAVDFKVKKIPGWLTVDQKKGEFKEEQILRFALAANKLPSKKTEAKVEIIGNGKMATIEVIFDPYSENAKGYLEYNGVVSIPANGYKENQGWEQIPDLGREDIALRPENRFSQELSEASSLTYEFSLKNDFEGTLQFYVSPSLDFLAKGGLELAYSVDGKTPQKLNILKDTKDNWGSSVSNNVTKVLSSLELEEGTHNLRVYALDPGVVLQQIVLQEKSAQDESYLGPPPSIKK
ncbi:MAG: glycosyl hydrolase 115 family protein [Christiangramia sp.]